MSKIKKEKIAVKKIIKPKVKVKTETKKPVIKVQTAKLKPIVKSLKLKLAKKLKKKVSRYLNLCLNR